jgi:hypothetical protein
MLVLHAFFFEGGGFDIFVVPIETTMITRVVLIICLPSCLSGYHHYHDPPHA